MNKFLFLILSLVVLLQSNISNATTLPYDFSDTERVLIKLSILEEISTKTPHLEGEDIKFKATEDVFVEISSRIESFIKTRSVSEKS